MLTIAYTGVAGGPESVVNVAGSGCPGQIVTFEAAPVGSAEKALRLVAALWQNPCPPVLPAEFPMDLSRTLSCK